MLRHRLIFGTLMIVVFVSVVTLDGWLDGSLWPDQEEGLAPVQGGIFAILAALLMIPAVGEFALLARNRGMSVLQPVTTISAVMLVLAWPVTELFGIWLGGYLAFVPAISLAGLFFNQNLRFGVKNTIANVGGSLFAIVYLGLLGGIAVAVRVDFGFWALILFVFAVKVTDIGAFFTGRAWGKRKFAPVISPNKSWEGMAGGAAAAVIISLIISLAGGIIGPLEAIVFGVLIAVIGQLGDCCESMIKRDAQAKDAANKVPGFGGILDVVDSPLIAGIFAYLYFSLVI